MAKFYRLCLSLLDTMYTTQRDHYSWSMKRVLVETLYSSKTDGNSDTGIHTVTSYTAYAQCL